MKTRDLQLGLIGAGGNAQARHLPGFRAIPGVTLKAVANRSVASAENVAAAWGIARVDADWRRIIEAPDIDAVCIGTWPATHAEMTVAALNAGKHVLCEARMAADLPGAEDMLRSSLARPELVAQIVPAPLTLAHDATARDILAGGRLGRLRQVTVTQCNDSFVARSGPLPWRLQSRHSGINVLSLGIFYETLERWIGSSAVPMQAVARLRPVPEGHPWTGADLPEEITVEGRFPDLDDCALTMHISAIHTGPAANEIRLDGTAGSLVWDGAKQTLSLITPGSPTEELEKLPGDLWRVEADFVDSIRHGMERCPVRLTSFEAGLSYMKFTNAVFSQVRGNF